MPGTGWQARSSGSSSSAPRWGDAVHGAGLPRLTRFSRARRIRETVVERAAHHAERRRQPCPDREGACALTDEHAAAVERGIAERGRAFEEPRAAVIDQRRDGRTARQLLERNVELAALVKLGGRAVDE